MAYAITLLLSGAYAGFGFFVYSIRKNEARLVEVGLVPMAGKMALSAVSLVSEIFFSVMFTETNMTFIYLAITILGMRVLNSVPTGFVLFQVFGPFEYVQDVAQEHQYRNMFAKDHFLSKVVPYAVLAFLSLFDCTLLALLPWLYSNFALIAQGSPSLLVLKTTSYYKVLQDLTRFLCNVLYLSWSRNKVEETSVKAMVALNIMVSAMSIVLALLVIIMKSSMLEEVEGERVEDVKPKAHMMSLGAS